MTEGSIPTVKAAEGASHGPSCNGCDRSRYSARYGQAWNNSPHSWCGELKRAIPMVLSKHDVWLRSELPADCPVHAQRPLFD